MEGSTSLLKLEKLLKPDVFEQVPKWWAQLSAIARARGRWVFEEPDGLPYPRQRVIHEFVTGDVSDVAHEPPDMSSENQAWQVSPALARQLKGPTLDAWKKMAHTTTNQAMDCAPAIKPANSERVWLRVMAKSHTALFSNDAMTLLAAWQEAGVTVRQKEAVSELLWALTDFLTAQRGNTEHRRQFGPKLVDAESKARSIINPHYCSIARPSSAPIASMAHMRLEATRRMGEAALMQRAQDALSRPRSGGPQRPGLQKSQIETLKSNVPMKWPGASHYASGLSEAQQQQRSVPSDMREKMIKQRIVYGPPPGSCVHRHVGRKAWHGDAKYPQLAGPASKSFAPIEQIMRVSAVHAGIKVRRG